MAEPLQQARLVQASNCGVEPGADLGPSRLRQGLDQIREATRLDLRDRHQLPAAGAEPARQEIRLPPNSSASATPFSTASDSLWRIGRTEPGGTGAGELSG